MDVNAVYQASLRVYVPSPPVRIPTRCDLRCFPQQETKQRATLLGDVSQPLMASTGVLARDQSDIAADLLAALEPLRSPDDQHEGQSAGFHGNFGGHLWHLCQSV